MEYLFQIINSFLLLSLAYYLGRLVRAIETEPDREYVSGEARGLIRTCLEKIDQRTSFDGDLDSECFKVERNGNFTNITINDDYYYETKTTLRSDLYALMSLVQKDDVVTMSKMKMLIHALDEC